MANACQIQKIGFHRRFLMLALLLPSLLHATVAYRGFAIDDSAVRELTEHPKTLEAIRRQIDMVHSVGLPEEVLSFLQSIELRILPRQAFRHPTPGRYMRNTDRSVHLSAGITRVSSKPVLLHELLHAYHDQQIEKGYLNPDILDLYAEAKSIPAFAPKSHMMSNAAEYFACVATTYLYGVTAQEPFRREKIRQQQPRCFDFLKRSFGPAAGTYEGSLEAAPARN